MPHSIILPLLMAALAVVGAAPESDLEIVPRSGWRARPPKQIDPMTNPVPYVIIHHSYIPGACSTDDQCVEAMQWMQNFHQDGRLWNDIGYHFAVGGNGLAYEGRGWSRVGAHAPRYNNISIGICVIGNWKDVLPPQKQLLAAKQLIEFGVKEGKIKEDYVLMAHKQVRKGTDCPGDALFEEITTWPHFSKTPRSPNLDKPNEIKTNT